jgi:MFS family permease
MPEAPFESRLQNLVYNVDVGFGLRLIKAGLYVLFVLCLMVLYTATQFTGLKEPEAMDCAQIGRNVTMHGSYATRCIRPASLWLLDRHADGAAARPGEHPELLHPPLYPAALAAGFGMLQASFATGRTSTIYPPEQWVVVPFGHLCTILTGCFVYLLARRLFDRRVAVIAMTVFFVSDAAWSTAISGTSLPLVTLLATAALYFGLVAVENRGGRGVLRWLVPFLLSAAACGLAVLTRYGAVVVAPAIALLVGRGFKERGARWAAVYLLLVAAAAAPWLARNVRVSGTLLGLAPYTALNGLEEGDGLSFERSLQPKPEAARFTPEMRQKWLANAAAFYRGDLRLLGDGVMSGLFVATFFFAFLRDVVRSLRWCVALALGLLLVLAGFFGVPTARLLGMFWPVAIVYGAAFFCILLDRLQFQVPALRAAVVSALVALCGLPLLFTLLPPRAAGQYPPYHPPYISHVCGMLQAGETLCTDIPWATAWYGDRSSVLLPRTLDEFYRIHDEHRKVSGIYFTTATRDLPYLSALVKGPYRSWFPLFEGRIPSDFPLTHGFPIHSMDQLFLTDRPRWQEGGRGEP